MTRLLCSLALGGLVATVVAQQETVKVEELSGLTFLVSGKNVSLLTPPSLVLPGLQGSPLSSSNTLRFSPNGRYLMTAHSASNVFEIPDLFASPERQQVALSIYDTQADRKYTVTLAEAEIAYQTAFYGTGASVVVVTLYKQGQRTELIDFLKGSRTAFAKEGSMASLWQNPKGGFALAIEPSEGNALLDIYDAAGRIKAQGIALNQPYHLAYDSQGRLGRVNIQTKSWDVFNEATRQFAPVAEFHAVEPNSPSDDETFKTATVRNEIGGSDVPGLFWALEPKPILLDINAGNPLMSPDGTMIAYAKAQGVYLRKVQPFSYDLFMGIKEAQLRAEAVTKAKQVALAMFMASDAGDERFPGAKDWKESIAPFLRDASMLDDFVYFMDGQLMTSIDNPAKTAIGQIDTELGTAIAYADGHVVWQKK